MARLPQPGGDSGNWGSILNDYLSQALKADGQLKDDAVTANTLAPNSVTNAAIATDAVNAASIADGSLTNALLADGTIEEGKLASAVQTKLNAPIVLADGSVAKAKLATSVQTTLDKADSALQAAPVTSVNGKTGSVTLDKNDIGMSNVDNTSDASKPVSAAAQSALDAKVTGVASSTDNTIARFDGTTGKLIQGSSVAIDDSGRIGIGTTTPIRQIQIKDVNDDYLAISSNDFIISAPFQKYPQFRLANSDGSWKFQLNPGGFVDFRDVSNNQPAFSLYPGTGANRMVMFGNGNVGLATNGTGSVAIGQTVAAAKLDVAGDVKVAGKIANVTNPTNAQDAATKNYVDTATDTKLSLSGGTLTGEITSSASASFNGPYNETTTIPGLYIGKRTNDSSRVMFANGTANQNWQIDNSGGQFRWFLPSVVHMALTSSSLDVKTKPVINVANPTNAQDAATKNYVDTAMGSYVDLANGQTIAGAKIFSGGITVGGQLARTGAEIVSMATRTSAVTLTTTSPYINFADATTASFIVTLPATTTAGVTFTIKKIDTGANTVSVASTSIDGNASIVLAKPNDFITVVSTTGSGSWKIVGGNVSIASNDSVSSQASWSGAVTLPSPLAPGVRKVQLTGNTTLTVPSGAANQSYTVMLDIVQDTTGSRTLTFSGVKWAYGIAPTLSTAANARDVISLWWSGSDWVGFVGAQGVS